MALSIYSFKSYKEFLNNKKSKVFGFGVMLMLIYFAVTMVAPLVKELATSGSLTDAVEESVPDFKLEDGYLWVDDVIELDDGDTYIYIDTDPNYFFNGADEMEQYLYGYTQAILMDSEKVIWKDGADIQEIYYADLETDFDKEDLLSIIPIVYVCIVIVMIIAFIWMTGLFFFGVLFVALLGMIVASCMKSNYTFGQLYLLGIYSRTLPLIIKAVLSLLSIDIPFFFVINFGISLVIIGCAIQKMKEAKLQQPLEFSTGNAGYNGNDYNTNADANNGNYNYGGNFSSNYNSNGADGSSSANNNGNDFSWMQ